MADKTLSQLIGNRAREIGDIIRTQASSLTDGRVLLSCDGTVLTPASYPTLEALLPAGAAYSYPDVFVSADGSFLGDNTAVNLGFRSHLSDTNTKAVVLDDDTDVWFQSAATAAEALTPNVIGNGAISSDGNEVLVGEITSVGSDLVANYSTAGAAPTSSVNIETTDSMAGVVITCMNAAGTSALVIAKNQTDSTLDTYISGANIGTGYTLANAYSYGANDPAATAIPLRTCWTDDLNAVAFCINTTNGVWLTTDQGLNWTPNIAPTERTVQAFALDQTDNLYVMDTGYDRIYKTANAGTSWTTLLTIHEALALIQSNEFYSARFVDMYCDVQNRWYVLVQMMNDQSFAGGFTMYRLGLLYSADQGTTWAYSTLADSYGQPLANNDNWSSTVGGFAFSPNGDRFMYSDASVASSRVLFFDVSRGKVLPLIPGHKIVADAP